MKNPKILITESGPCVFDAPVEPKEPDYGDCEMDASDTKIHPHALYKQRMNLWTTGMKQYEIELSESKKPENVIYFKDQEEIKKTLIYFFFDPHDTNPLFKDGEEFDIPSGYDLLFEDAGAIDAGKFKNWADAGTRHKVAILKKQDSAHGFTEGSKHVFIYGVEDSQEVSKEEHERQLSGWIKMYRERYPEGTIGIGNPVKYPKADEPQPGDASEMLKLQMLINHLEHNGINVKWNGEHWEPLVMPERTAEETVFVTNKVAEIAQWVIDNRYPKDDRYKISDWEMYQHICESIEALVKK